MTMFYGIDVDVIDMTREIVFIANLMSPEAALPDAAFALAQA